MVENQPVDALVGPVELVKLEKSLELITVLKTKNDISTAWNISLFDPVRYLLYCIKNIEMHQSLTL